MKRRLTSKAAAAVAAALTFASLTAGAGSAATATPAPALPKLKNAKVVRIGFFANVTHGSALIAQEKKFFEKYLKGTKIEYVAFNAGPAVVEAMKGGSIDVSFIGPNPAVAGYVSTRGSLLRIVAGSTTGGAQFITKQTITTVADLKGKTFATPQLGNTQDVALRSYLKSKGYTTSILGSGDVNIAPTANASTLDLFKNGSIDGAWVPEPWASRLVLEANGRVFLDEKSLWPKGKFVTTNIIASQSFLKSYPGTVRSLLQAVQYTNKWAKANAAAAKDAVQNQLLKWSGKKLSDEVINRAWPSLTFTLDPVAAQLAESVDAAVDAGTLTNVGSRGIAGIYDLRLLNQILKFQKLKTYKAAGLGQV